MDKTSFNNNLRPLPIIGAALIALSLGLTTATALAGFSINPPFLFLQWAALIFLAASFIFAIDLVLALQLADWSGNEADFEAIVVESERLAGEMGDDLDPFADQDFACLVREALEDLPPQFKDLLNRNVAVIISDDGEAHQAYGLYQGTTRDDYPNRIIIFRDTLRRDFGFDAQRLQSEVRRVVRHEVAHHVGFDEDGVTRLGL